MNKMGEENFMSTKVMLVDDHALIREGIKQLLEFDGSIDVIEQASDGADVLKNYSMYSLIFYYLILICPT